MWHTQRVEFGWFPFDSFGFDYVPGDNSPSSRSLMSFAACMPSSLRLRSMRRLLAAAARSSADCAQPMVRIASTQNVLKVVWYRPTQWPTTLPARKTRCTTCGDSNSGAKLTPLSEGFDRVTGLQFSVRHFNSIFDFSITSFRFFQVFELWFASIQHCNI